VNLPKSGSGLARPDIAVNPTLILAVLAFSSFCASLMQSLVIPIQQDLHIYLNTSQGNASWVITATLLGGAVAMPVAGRLADMYGKKPILVASSVILLAGSLLCALSSSLIPVLIGRALQGVAMGYIPVAMSFVREVVPPKMSTTAVAVISATLGVGGALGLPLAAWIAESGDWHALFWVATALAAVMVVTSIVLLPHVRDAIEAKLDWIGALGLAAGLVAFLIGISKGHDWEWTSGSTLGCIFGGLVILLIWGWYQLRASDPLVDLRTTANRPVLMTNLAAVLIGFGMMAQAIVVPQLLQMPKETGYGMAQSMLAAGLWMAPGGLMMMFFAPVSAKLIGTIGGRKTLTIGALVVAVGYVMAVFMIDEPWKILIATCVGSAGVGIGYSAMPTLIMQNVPASEAGAAVGLNGLMRSIGTTTSSAVMAVLLTSSTIVGTAIPTLGAYKLCFWVGAAAAVVGAVFAFAAYPSKKISPAELQEVAAGTA